MRGSRVKTARSQHTGYCDTTELAVTFAGVT